MTLLCRQNNALSNARSKSEQLGLAWHVYQDKNMISYILVASTSLADDKASVFLRSLSAQLYEANSSFKKNPQSIDSLQAEASAIINELQANFDKTASA